MRKGRKWQRVVAGALALFMGASSFHCAALKDYGWTVELGNTGGFRPNTGTVAEYSEIDGSGLLTAINSIAMLRYEEDGVSEALWGEKLQEIVERGWITWDNNNKSISVHALFPVWAVYETDVPMVSSYTSLHILTPNVEDGGHQVKVGLKWTKKLWRDLRYLPVYRKGEEAFSNNYGRNYLGYADIYEGELGSGKDSLYIPVIVPETTQVYTAQPNSAYSVPLSLVEGAEECNVAWATEDLSADNNSMRAEVTADGDYKVTVDQGATAGELVIIRVVVEDYEDYPVDITVTAKDKKVDTSYTITYDTEQIAVPANEGAEPELAWYYGEAPATFTMQDPEGMLEGGTRTTYWKNVGTEETPNWVACDQPTETTPVGTYKIKEERETADTYYWAEKEFTIKAAPVDIDVQDREKTYDEAAIAPAVEVTRNGTSIPAEYVERIYAGTKMDGTPYGPTDTAPTDAGTYTLTVRATGNYIGEVTFELSILRDVITITADDQTVEVGDTLPSPKATISENGQGKFSVEPVAYYLKNDTGVIDLTGNVASKVGTATIGIKDWVLRNSENYEVAVTFGTLTVKEKPKEETGGGETGGGTTGGGTTGGSSTGGGSTGGSSTGGGTTGGGSTGGGSTGGSSTGGGGVIGAEKIFPPKWEIEKGGDATIDIKNPKEGDKVTITPKPAPTRKVESVIVITDKGGKEILVTSNGDGTYSYTQPGDTVIIKVNFCERSSKEGCPRDETCPIWPFPDAGTREWYHNGVHYCLEEGLMVGYPDATFQPGTYIDRGMLVTMLWRLAGEPVSTVEQAFTDVSAGAWYEKAVNWASEQGIVFGVGDGTFRPEDPLTREQNAAIFLRYSQYRGMDVSVGEQVVLSDYTDADSIQDYAVYAMQWGVGAGLLDGLPDGRLMPHGTASRAEAATMMMRYCENIMK